MSQPIRGIKRPVRIRQSSQGCRGADSPCHATNAVDQLPTPCSAGVGELRTIMRPMRCAAIGLALLCLSIGPTLAQPVLVSLQDVLTRADQHPDVSIARADVEAAEGGLIAADRLPLPIVSASAASIDLQNGIGPGSWTGGKRLDKGVGIDWTWERGDKRSLRTRSAESGLEASRQDQAEALLTRRIAIASAYWSLLAAQDREADSQEMLRSAEQMADLSRRRLEKGDISEQEAARVSIETERTRSDDAALRTARELAAVALAQAAGLSGFHPRAEPNWPTYPARMRTDHPRSAATAPEKRETAPPTITGDQIDARPDVRAAQARVRAARAALDLARSLQITDVTIGGGINNYPPDQRASVQFRAQFPWQVNYRYEGEIRQALGALQRAEESLRQVTLSAQAELGALALQRVATASRLAGIESQILPRAREVLDRSEAAYSRGATPLTELLDARRTYRAVRLDAIQARLDAAQADTEWRLRTGSALK